MGRKRKIRYGVEIPEIYEKGEYKGYTYYIIEQYMNPAAYIVIPKGRLFKRHKLYKLELEDIYVPVHGGITYKEDTFAMDDIGKNNFIIGWDYAHSGDYIEFEGSLPEFMDKKSKGKSLSDMYKDYNKNTKKYDYKDIMEDVKAGIDYLVEEY